MNALFAREHAACLRLAHAGERRRLHARHEVARAFARVRAVDEQAQQIEVRVAERVRAGAGRLRRVHALVREAQGELFGAHSPFSLQRPSYPQAARLPAEARPPDLPRVCSGSASGLSRVCRFSGFVFTEWARVRAPDRMSDKVRGF